MICIRIELIKCQYYTRKPGQKTIDSLFVPVCSTVMYSKASINREGLCNVWVTLKRHKRHNQILLSR